MQSILALYVCRTVGVKCSIRENMVSGGCNIIKEPLVEINKTILPPLHVKLGLIKELVQALDKEGNCFKHICKAFPGLTNKKPKAEYLMVFK